MLQPVLQYLYALRCVWAGVWGCAVSDTMALFSTLKALISGGFFQPVLQGPPLWLLCAKYDLVVSVFQPVLQCSYCPEICMGRDALDLHVETVHAGDKRNKCPICAAYFLTPEDFYWSVQSSPFGNFLSMQFRWVMTSMTPNKTIPKRDCTHRSTDRFEYLFHY